ncbi:MAG: hypothetical protein NUW37_07550 [Planctomycetes bacterium]|nr:hypothetical protein [Planctomycetota bacterium]
MKSLRLAFIALTLFVTFASCGSDSASPSEDKSAPRPDEGGAGSQSSRLDNPAVSVRNEAPSFVYLLNPTLQSQSEAGIRLSPLEVREATDAEIRALGISRKPGFEIVRTIGDPATFINTKRYYSSDFQGPPPEEIERRITNLMEAPAGEFTFRFIDEAPDTVDPKVHYMTIQVEFTKLTWLGPELGSSAWNDELRYTVLSSNRPDMENAREIRQQAYATLDKAEDPRFGPLILGWLTGTSDTAPDGADRGFVWMQAITRFESAITEAMLDDALSKIEERESKNRSGDQREDLRGPVVALYALKGNFARSREVIPTARQDAEAVWQFVRGIPDVTIWSIGEPLLNEMTQRGRNEFYRAVLWDDTAVPPAETISKMVVGAGEDAVVKRTLQIELRRRVTSCIADISFEQSVAIMDFVMPMESNDRFPIQDFWRYGPERWDVVRKYFGGLSEMTRAVIVKECLAFGATMDEKQWFIESGLSDESERVVRETLTWIADNTDSLPEEFKAKALERAKQPAFTNTTFGRRIIRAYEG